MERRNAVLKTMKLQDLLFDPERHYRVTIVHGEDHTGFKILTTYHSKVKGRPERRSAQLVQALWPDFWDELGRRVFVQLA